MQVGWLRLLPHALANGRRQRPLARGEKAGLPFAIPAIEQKQLIAGFEPEHILQVVRLAAVERDLPPAGERSIEIDARGAEIVIRHKLTIEPIVTDGPV